LYIQFFPTLRCNASCGFCFNRGISSEQDIGIGDFYRIAHILNEAGIREIDFLGGEPTLHPELITLIDISCSKGLFVSLSTNGSDVLTLKSLSGKFDSSQLTVGISLNGGPIDEALASYISEYKPLLKSVSTSKSFLPDSLIRFLDIPGIRHYAIFMDTLDASDLKNSLSFPQFYRSLNEHQAKCGSLEGVYCSGFITDAANCSDLDKVRCPAGTSKLSIMPDGSVYPCYLFFGQPKFRLGNILCDDLSPILNNPELDFFSRFEKNNCPDTTCKHLPFCHGGCPALSLIIHGDLNAPDPRCLNQTTA
jgi:radical SAM protein with 4Fe4S-binding SPASM domain